MTENKNPEQSSDELLDLISRYSDANKIKKGDESSQADPIIEGEKETDVKLFEETVKESPVWAVEEIKPQPTRVSNKEFSVPQNSVPVIKADEPHYTEQAEENTVMSAPEDTVLLCDNSPPDQETIHYIHKMYPQLPFSYL